MVPLCIGRRRTEGHFEENPGLLYVLEEQKDRDLLRPRRPGAA